MVSGPFVFGGPPPPFDFLAGQQGALVLLGLTLFAFNVAVKFSILLFNSWILEFSFLSTTPMALSLAEAPLLSVNSSSASLAASNNSS